MYSIYFSISVRFLVSLFKNLYGVYKNPQCSWECCLGVILSTIEAEPNLRVAAGDVASQDVRRGQVLLFHLSFALIQAAPVKWEKGVSKRNKGSLRLVRLSLLGKQKKGG